MNEQEFDQLLEKYADVIVRVGLNIRSGQRLRVTGQIESAELIRKVARSAYQAGARYVDVIYTDEQVERIRYEQVNPDWIAEVPDWTVARFEEYDSRGDAALYIASVNPDLLAGIDPDLIAAHRKAFRQKLEPLRKYENLSNWCVVAAAAPAWAQKVFPGSGAEDSMTKLWEAIFNACRIDVPDPVSAWEAHIQKLVKYKDYLNSRRYSALHYTGPSTDLRVGLANSHVWNGAQESYKNGTTGTPNIPTEEVFTAPHRERAEGMVTASLPLNMQGVTVEEFSVRFENGRVVQFAARTGEADLRRVLETDENAGRLGEVALVPHSSPISQRGHLFYNTLFDENAASHIALGNAYRSSVRGGEDMTDEEFAASGGNKSLVHVDFMIGSGELDVDGVREDGRREPVMRAGEWAFEV